MIVFRSGNVVGPRQLVGAAALVLVERRRQAEDGLAVLHGDYPPGGERAAVADAVNVQDEAPARQARSQEVSVQRMGMVVGVDGEGGGAQRLRRHLATKQPPVVPVGRAAAPKKVAVESLEVEQPEQALDRRWQVLDVV